MGSAALPFIPRKVWTRDEVNRLSWDGLKLELIKGELIDRMGKNPPHIYWKNLLRDWFMLTFGSEHVRTEDPVDVSPEDNPTSEPEPDLVLTVASIRESRGRNPSPSEIRLVVEVSDSTFWFDRNVKAELYARAGIREYWIVDVRNAAAPSVIVLKQPMSGSYVSATSFGADETIVFEGREFRLERL